MKHFNAMITINLLKVHENNHKSCLHFLSLHACKTCKLNPHKKAVSVKKLYIKLKVQEIYCIYAYIYNRTYELNKDNAHS